MKNVLIRQSVLRSGTRAYHDLELDISEVTIGSDAACTIVVHGSGIQSKHAIVTLTKRGKIAVSSGGKHPLIVNGEESARAELTTGDVFSVGGHSVLVLPVPPGFDLAIQVDLDPTEVGKLDESSFRTDISDLSIGKRRPAWVFALLILATFLGAPLLYGMFEGDERLAAIPAFLTDRFWSSGELHPAHSLEIGSDCKACHVSSFSRVPDDVCVECHQSITHHASESMMVEGGHSTDRCGSCHREHDEPHTMLDDSGVDCENCHTVTSLAGDHPEFKDYPNPERPRIMFDHDAHDLKHFGKTEREFECSSCHRLDPAGQHQIIGEYEDICVDCHGEAGGSAPDRVYHHGDQIASSDPVVIFSLPALDLRTLGGNSGIGAWPEETRRGVRNGLTKLGLTPFVELMLFADPSAGPALGRLRSADVKLKSLKKASEAEIADVASVVWGLKLLLDELDFYPTDTVIRYRLSSLVPDEMPSRELLALSGQLNAGVVDNAVDLWFRGPAGKGMALSVDIQRAGVDTVKHPEADSESVAPQVPGLPGVRTGRWSEDKFALHYHPSGHLDDFLKAWLDLAMELKQVLEPAPDGQYGPREAAETLYDELADAGADPGKARGAGRCTKCHSEVEGADGLRRVAWTSIKANPLVRHYTRYGHADHVGEDKMEICEDCHIRAENSDILSAYKDDASSLDFASNYQPLTIDTCAGCHAPNAQASDTCITCHRYHVTEPLQLTAGAATSDEGSAVDPPQG